MVHSGKPAPTTTGNLSEKQIRKQGQAKSFQYKWSFLARLVDIQINKGYRATVRAFDSDVVWGGENRYVPFKEHPDMIAMTWAPKPGDIVEVELRGMDFSRATIIRRYDLNHPSISAKQIDTDPHQFATATGI